MTKNLSIAQKGTLYLIAFASLFLFATLASANPLYVSSKASTAIATTTVVYQGTGTATTTLVYDSYESSGTNQQNNGNITVPNTIALAIQGTASSSSAIINIACEYSDDGIDYYQNEIFPATTTNPINISVPNTFTFGVASSTVGGVAFNGYKKLFTCPVPTRFVRAIITNTGAQIGFYSSFLPLKQRN